ncbi:hypothetical protein FRX31_028480 [Thalictrum thalictroides]|uniref:Uncharacterized protein n=1 Tax=Thalictrum thalictroides TaxID=46969 RepID=A0A7J6VA16_THATH|nr:hypothetical protein FRX31_028480 [Thalictrum thalictroides]
MPEESRKRNSHEADTDIPPDNSDVLKNIFSSPNPPYYPKNQQHPIKFNNANELFNIKLPLFTPSPSVLGRNVTIVDSAWRDQAVA